MNKVIYLLFIFSICYTIIKADEKCMDRSRHAYFCNDGAEVCALRYHDDKKLHRVPCSCPCWRYKTTKKCVYCGHYRDPKDTSVHGRTTYPSIKFAECSPKQRPQYYVPKRRKCLKKVNGCIAHGE